MCHGLYEGIKLLSIGIWWRVGDGDVYLWTDLWIPRSYQFKPLPFPRSSTANLRVADFMLLFPRGWNIPKLR